MNNIPDGSFDLVVVCDVLEHVSDDSAALLELHRILDLDAWAIITVPQKDNLVSKYEDFSLTTAEDRKKAFGRGDHLRIYGNDFGQFLESHGFKVKIIDESNFSNDTVRRHVLCPPILSTHPLATNFRKVYFAKKSIASK